MTTEERLLPLPYSEELKFAEHLARAAGEVLRSAFGRVAAREKGPSDLVTEADTDSQRLIATMISDRFPEHTLHAEEENVVPDPSCAWKWIVDPLDGTINFAHGFPFWCVSIGLEHAGKRVVGVVYEPLTDTCYSATLGGGARRNGQPIHVSQAKSLKSCLISAGLPTDFAKDAERQMSLFRAFSTETHSVRRTGSTALNLALIAAGGFDVYYTTSVHPWDVAAGLLLVTEAGGMICAIDGMPYSMDQPSLLVTNSHVHGESILRARQAMGKS